jgi:long-chain fatty acid transport protein
MKKQVRRLGVPVTCVGVAMTPWLSLATGFRLPDQDAFATARGEAFAATADNPSAIFYNPAGITQLEGHQIRGGVYGLNLQVSYESPSGHEVDNEEDLFAIPQFFYTFTPEKFPLSFGLGVYSPYGLSSRWPDDSGFRTVATEGKLSYYCFNPVVAYEIRPGLSVAAGLTVNQVDLELQQGMFWPASGDDGFRFKGDGWTAGFNAGVLWKACEQLSFGVNFRSATRVGLEGTTEAYNSVLLPNPAFPGGALPPFTHESDAEMGFRFPLNVVMGVSYRPTPKWNIEFNADFTDWDYLNTATIRQADQWPPAPFPALLPNSIPVPLNWDSSWYYEFGVTHYFDSGWTVSAGYIFNENSVPDTNYNPLVFDLDRHFWSAGAGYHWEHASVDLAYQFGYGPTRTVSGSAPSPGGQTADGDYDFSSHALFLSFGWRF